MWSQMCIPKMKLQHVKSLYIVYNENYNMFIIQALYAMEITTQLESNIVCNVFVWKNV